MEKYGKVYIVILIATNLFLVLCMYWLGLQSVKPVSECFREDYQGLARDTDRNGLEPVSVPPASEHANLPSPNVHSEAYLIRLAHYEAFVHQALSELTRNYSNLYRPGLILKIDEYLFVYMHEISGIDSENRDELALEIARNPVLALKMIWRFVSDLTEIYESIQDSPYNSRVLSGPAKSLITDLKSFDNWPTQETIEEAMIGLLRIQMVHNLEANDVVNGLMLEGTARVSTSLIWELGLFARKSKLYTLAVPWLELLFRDLTEHEQKLKPGDKQFRIRAAQVERVLLEAMAEHDTNLRSAEALDFNFYQNELLSTDGHPVKERVPVRSTDLSALPEKGPKYNEAKYYSLCAGQNRQTPQENAELSCWFDMADDLPIYPIKMELLSASPYVIQIYNALGKADMANLLQAASKSMGSTASDTNIDTAISETVYHNKILSSKSSIVTEVSGNFPRLDKFIEISTGMRVDAEEKITFSEYNNGGHKNCPSDVNSGLSENPATATMMFYLDYVDAGGYTVFPQAGFAVKPIRGSALFWYNLKENGEVDAKAQNCECPVVVGHKMTATKQIHQTDQ